MKGGKFGDEREGQKDDVRTCWSVTFGVPHTKQEFVKKSLELEHPLEIDAFDLAGDDQLRAMGVILIGGPTW
eukprot:10176717-Heterocapsa_arctica.AAC.1